MQYLIKFFDENTVGWEASVAFNFIKAIKDRGLLFSVDILPLIKNLLKTIGCG